MYIDDKRMGKFNHFPKEKKKALDALSVLFKLEYNRISDDSIEFILDKNNAIRRSVVISGIDSIYATKGQIIDSCDVFYHENTDSFSFFGNTMPKSGEKSYDNSFWISFSDVFYDVKIFDCTENNFITSSPWQYLENVCSNIHYKSRLSREYLNKKEAEILPLITEVTTLSESEVMSTSKLRFPILKELAKKYNLEDYYSILCELENDKISNLSKLKECSKDREPMWQEIFSLIKNSQSEYPSIASVIVPTDVLSKNRGKIEEILKAKGYEGSFPDFVKTSVPPIFSVVNSNDIAYVAVKSKNQVIRSYIHCFEAVNDDTYTINFLCATSYIKAPEKENIYSCLFDYQGKTCHASGINYNVPISEKHDGKDLRFKLKLAIKKAENKRLTKEERDFFCSKDCSKIKVFLTSFLLVGGLFAVLMTLICFIISLLLTLIFSSSAPILNVIKSIPWWLVFTFCWLGFGIPLGLIDTYSKFK